MFKHEQMFILLITTLVSTTNANSSGFTIVLKHRAPLARGAIFLPKKVFYDGFLLMWCNFKFV